MAEYTRAEAKEWARETFRGVENVLTPSLKTEVLPEGSTWNLDEAGIRHDVNECARHGFFMTTLAVEGLPFMLMEYLIREFWEIAVEESRGKILVDAFVSQNTLDDTLAAAKLAEELGCDCIMLTYPPFHNFSGEDEIFEFTKAVCDSIDIAVVAFPTHKCNFERFHSSTFNPRLVARITEIENVVAVKLGVINTSHSTQCFQLCGDKALLQAPYPEYWNTYVPYFGQQYAGCGPFEMLQDHEHLYVVDYMNLLLEGKFDEAMEVYWKFFPAYETLMREFFDSTVEEGNYNISHWKYFGWLAGFNGGPMTLPVAKIYEHQKERMRAMRASVGLSNREPEEEFYVGRVNYTAAVKEPQLVS